MFNTENNEYLLLDKESAISFLKSKGVNCLHHFTAKSNVEIIKRMGGLYSSFYLKNNEQLQSQIVFGGDKKSLIKDKEHGYDKYVCLSFCKCHPMSNGLAEPVFLNIDLSIISDNMIVTDGNALAVGHKEGRGFEALRLVNYSVFDGYKRYQGDPDYYFYQAEVKIMDHIPIEYIQFPKE